HRQTQGRTNILEAISYCIRSTFPYVRILIGKGIEQGIKRFRTYSTERLRGSGTVGRVLCEHCKIWNRTFCKRSQGRKRSGRRRSALFRGKGREFNKRLFGRQCPKKPFKWRVVRTNSFQEKRHCRNPLLPDGFRGSEKVEGRDLV